MAPDTPMSKLTVKVDGFSRKNKDGSTQKIGAVDAEWDVNIQTYKWGSFLDDLSKHVTCGLHQEICLSRKLEIKGNDDLVFDKLDKILNVHASVKNTNELMPSKHFSRQPPFGITNRQLDCFLNVTLQCLMANRSLLSYLYSEEYGDKCRNNGGGWCFTCAFKNMIERASNSSRPEPALDILDHLFVFGTEFIREEGEHKMCDAARLMIGMLDHITSPSEEHPNNARYITKMYTGVKRHVITCGNCDDKSEGPPELFNQLDLVIHSCDESLENALEGYKHSTVLEDSKCPKCDAIKRDKRYVITEIAETLVIALTRHGHNRVVPTKLQRRISCPFKLDLSSYVSQPSEGIENYELSVVVTHQGPTTLTGHYICYAKYNTQWYKIEDAAVETMDEQQVSKEITDCYFLLYKRNIGEISESLDGHETVQVDTRKVRNETTIMDSAPSRTKFQQKLGDIRDKDTSEDLRKKMEISLSLLNQKKGVNGGVKDIAEAGAKQSAHTTEIMPSKHFSRRPPFGIANRMLDCFLNATLQCLMANRSLLSYLCSEEYGDKCRNNGGAWCFTCAFKNMIETASNSSRPEPALDILDHLGVFGTEFIRKKGEQKMCDAAELMIGMLDHITSPSKEHPNNAHHITKMYIGWKHHEITCRNCDEKIEGPAEHFNHLDLVIQSCDGSLENALEAYKNSTALEDTKCPKCNATKRDKRYVITEIGETLVIALTRHGHDGVEPIKLEKRISCPLKLDLSSYVSQPSEGIENYELCAVVTHKGPTTLTGHYICYAKHNTQWYKIDDAAIETMDEQQVSNKITDCYCLFYKRNTGEISESLDGHETVPVDTRKVRNKETIIDSNDEYLPFDDDPEFEDILFNFFSADPSKYPTDRFLKGGYLIETKWNKFHPHVPARTKRQCDKLRRGRFLTETTTNNELRDMYIIAEDRPPQDVLNRIDDITIHCDDKKGIYHFKVPYQQGIEYEELLGILCVRGGKRTYSVFSTNHDAGKAQEAFIIYTIITVIRGLLKKGQFKNKRELWYAFNAKFGISEKSFYNLIHKICMMLRTTRLSLGISVSDKGLICGPVALFVNGGRLIDCSMGNKASIPHDAHLINCIETPRPGVSFILLVEKDTIFSRLLRMGFHVKYNCILLCGKGYSDLATRTVAHKLSNQLNVRVYALADYNPDGLVVMFSYKYGSRTSTYTNLQLSVPDLICLTLHLNFEFVEAPVNPPQDSRPLNERDMAMLENLIEGPMPLNTNEMGQVHQMILFGFKMDLESIFSDGYAVENFLRSQIVEMSHYYDEDPDAEEDEQPPAP